MIVLGSFMVILDTTIVNVALPRIIQVFQTDVNQGQLVITGYMLALAVVMPATGYVSDRLGSKRTYMLTISLFTLGSALCGLAPSIEGLIAFRVLQGLGGGMVMPLGMIQLFRVAPPGKRGAIMGIFGLPILVAPILGPTVGGYLVEYVDWRPIFTLNVPVGALALLAGSVILRETPGRGGLRFDWAGFVLSAVGFSAAMLGLEMAPADGWTAPHVVALWLITAVAIPCWIVVELSQEQPLLDLSVLRNPTYRTAMLINFVTTSALFSSMFLMPLFLQNVRGMGAMETGMLLMPQAMMAALTMPIAGRLLDKVGPTPLVVPGLLILAYATWSLTTLDITTSDSTIRGILMLRGVGMGMTMMPVTTTAMDSIPPHQLARASALQNVLRQIFGAFGTGMFASLLLGRQQLHRAVLVQDVTASNATAMGIFSTIKTSLLSQGATDLAAQTTALSALMKQVALSAAVLSYDDCFIVASTMAMAGVVPALMLRRARRHPAGQH